MIMSAQTHLIHQFDEDLDELKHLLYSMGDLVTEQINNATKAFRTGDIDLAQSVKDRDAAINSLKHWGKPASLSQPSRLLTWRCSH